MKEAWYKKSFGAAYLELYSHRTNEEALEQIKGLLNLIDPSMRGPTLDLCCGAGRHLVALRELGMKNLTGLDLSEHLLSVAELELNGADNENVELIQGDMRYIPRKNFYKNIFSLFTSFGYFDSDIENISVINGVYSALKPGGVFLMDYLNRNYIIKNLIADNVVQGDGYTVHNTRWITDDGKRVEKKIVFEMNTGERQEFNESVRMYSENEMIEMCENAGFVGIKMLGGLNKEPLNSNASRMIITATK